MKFRLLLILLLGLNFAKSQDVSFEEIKAYCDQSIPFNERPRVTVSRFSSKVSTKGKVGEELATMLTNALYQVQCFNVLESAGNMNDFDNEFNLNDSGYTSSNSTDKGKMLSTQAIITGEITEFGEGKNSLNFSGIGFGKKEVHVGFILKVLNANTRQILYSQSINMDGKANGFSGVSAFGFKLAGKENRSKALNIAIEKAIIKATELLAKDKSIWVQNLNFESAQMANRISIKLSNISYQDLLKVHSKLSKQKGIHGIEKTFQNNIAQISAEYTGTTDDLTIVLLESFPSININEVTKNHIDVSF